MITGAAGQLGYELQRTAPSGAQLCAVDIAQLDLTDADAVETFVRTNRPTTIINGAAYTAVDRAESEPGVAQAVNVEAAVTLALAISRDASRLVRQNFALVKSYGSYDLLVRRRAAESPAESPNATP